MRPDIIDLLKRGLRNPGNIPEFVVRTVSEKGWPVWQSLGFHVVPNHFYYPIPDTADLRERRPWDERYPTDGIDLREDAQLGLLDTLAEYVAETSFAGTGMIPRPDGAILYAMVREHRPDRVVEVGSGTSTRLLLDAAARNPGQPTDIVSVEPYPDDDLRQLAAAHDNLRLVESRAETVPVETFLDLEAGDFLFVDSSHHVTIGNDVAQLYLRVLPQLADGVYVHSHDIFFPSEYPEEWTLDKHRFWSEQYLLQAFLLFNDAFEVVWSGRHIAEARAEAFTAVFPEADGGGSSFWIRRTE